MDYVEARKHLVRWLRRQMIGPTGDDKIIAKNPLECYHVGVLSPVEFASNIQFDVSQEREVESHSYRRFYEAPSSVGFTIYVSHDAHIHIEASASYYKGLGFREASGEFKRQSYRRQELEKFAKAVDQLSDFSQQIWGDRAGVVLKTYPHTEGVLCTVALYNCQQGLSARRNIEKVNLYLFEADLKCSITSGRILELPRTERSEMTESELELELQYRSRKIFAVGHAAAVDWEVKHGSVPQVWSEFMPTVEMPALSTNPQGDHKALDFKYLYQESITDISNSVNDFLKGYENWIAEQRKLASDFSDITERKTALRMVTRMEEALKRMHKGRKLLCEDENVERAFRIANQAMLDQMRQGDRIAGRDVRKKTYRWRSFQLAFLLTVLESAISEESDFRETMDLIWFPTGGGKTEAYLGLIAILMIWRRLKYGDRGGGTVAIMRYTLRLLTRQQFQRATRMICALERIRSQDENLGEESFSVGLWVGRAVTPNRYDQARGDVQEIQSGDKSKRYNFVLTSCPWCGQELEADGYVSETVSFWFECKNGSNCDFGMQKIPCQIVDDALYDAPPSLLISTVDKFAGLPWREEPRVFFGRGGGRPPDLIIQDELHLVSGPLGSVASVYEAGIETVIKKLGVTPKYIASTATISEVYNQVKKIYACSVQIFPPPGLSCDDMYFAKSNQAEPGRMYMGYLAPSLSKQKSMTPLMASLIVAPAILFAQEENFSDLAEAWWTAVVFNRSLMDVRTNHLAVSNDVRKEANTLIDKYSTGGNEEEEYHKNLQLIRNRLNNLEVGELTSLRSAEACAVTFAELENQLGDDRCLDVVLATNMISVGLDVSRLALMIVNGQPQTTGEYIQVTSRVGRAEVPGLVVVNYYRTQARSLAHYENFRPFHESFHRFVESSSVTPFTRQVRQRALHAALVTALRYACTNLTENSRASRIGEDSEKEKEIRESLIKRFCQACDDQSKQDQMKEHLDQLYQEWLDKAKNNNHRRRQLCYKVPKNKKHADRLLTSHESHVPGLWKTLPSMRNVEEQATLCYGNAKMKVRFSELLRTSGVGSIVRLEDEKSRENFLVTVPDVRKWFQQNTPPLGQELKYVTQVRKHPKIGNRRLIQPPRSDEHARKRNKCIRVTRFPRWSSCIQCGLLSYLPKDQECVKEECSGRMKQVQWILVHPFGYIADVDWHYMAHGKKSKECPRKQEPYLRLKQGNNNKVVCTQCKSEGWNEMMQFGSKTYQQPWIQEPAVEGTEKIMAEVMQIGDSRIYVPENHKALVIPPESRIQRGRIVDQLYRNTDDLRKIQNANPGLDRKSELRLKSSKYECTVPELEEALLEIEHGYPLYDREVIDGDPMRLEYEALFYPMPDQKEDEDLVTTHYTKQWKKQSREDRRIALLIDRLVAVERLRMISVFTGFRRLALRGSRGANAFKQASLVPPDISGDCDFLPADELYGEGIFFTINENLLRKWEAKVSESRAKDGALNRFLSRVEDEPVATTPRFLLIHSLAHALIRQLERSCGYQVASLQERIYCTLEERNPMAGVLIYVAVSDKHGSLGGIMEYAEPVKFRRLLMQALDAVRWCSFDPVCCTSQDNKTERLNGAACHACLMIPESSCCCNNKYLDRTMINGNGRDLPAFIKMINL